MAVPPDPTAAPLLVACLCAEWCGACREYRSVFEGLAGRFAGAARFVWIDIEDDDEALGSIDVENFPTLLLARGDRVHFYGTVLPHAQTAARLIENGLADALPPLEDAGLAALAVRVQSLAAERGA